MQLCSLTKLQGAEGDHPILSWFGLKCDLNANIHVLYTLFCTALPIDMHILQCEERVELSLE